MNWWMARWWRSIRHEAEGKVITEQPNGQTNGLPVIINGAAKREARLRIARAHSGLVLLEAEIANMRREPPEDKADAARHGI